MSSIPRSISSEQVDWREVVFDLTYRRKRTRVEVAAQLGMSSESLTQIGNGIRGKQITYNTGCKLTEAWMMLMIPKLVPEAKVLASDQDVARRNRAIREFLGSLTNAVVKAEGSDDGDAGFVFDQIADFLRHYSEHELLELARGIKIKRPVVKVLSKRSEVQFDLPLV